LNSIRVQTELPKNEHQIKRHFTKRSQNKTAENISFKSIWARRTVLATKKQLYNHQLRCRQFLQIFPPVKGVWPPGFESAKFLTSTSSVVSRNCIGVRRIGRVLTRRRIEAFPSAKSYNLKPS
jgi:hypothetical protein